MLSNKLIMVDAMSHQNEYSNFIMVVVGATLDAALLHPISPNELIGVSL
jgi:hypothetical protein